MDDNISTCLGCATRFSVKNISCAITVLATICELSVYGYYSVISMLLLVLPSNL